MPGEPFMAEVARPRAAVQRMLGSDVAAGIGLLAVEEVDPVDRASLQPREVLVMVKACCVNFPDLLRTAGGCDIRERLNNDVAFCLVFTRDVVLGRAGTSTVQSSHIVQESSPSLAAFISTFPLARHLAIEAFAVLSSTRPQLVNHTATTLTADCRYAGRVVAVGRDVMSVSPGDRVTVGSTRVGGCQSEAVVQERECSTAPLGLTFAEAACFNVGYSTAYHCLVERAGLQPGETVLVNGATGGMGLAAVQVARAVGAKLVVGTGGTDAKLATVRACGADHTINYTTRPEFASVVKEHTGGRGVDVVFDSVGGDQLFGQCLSSAVWGGRVAIVGFTSGAPAHVATNRVLIKGLTILGCRAGEALRRAKAGPTRAANQRRAQLQKWAARGLLVPHISHRFDLADVRAAFHTVLQRKVIGRVVVTMPGYVVSDDADAIKSVSM